MGSMLDNLFKSFAVDFPDIPFEVELWDGSKRKYGLGDKKFKLVIKDKESINRVFSEGSIGFGEEFMKGNLQVEGNIQDLLRMSYDRNYTNLKLSFKNKLEVFWRYIFSLGFISNSRKNISHHYDIGNEFYSLWLDNSLTYSCAYFKKNDDTLGRAQLNKYEHISRKLQLKKGEKLIDIGCGWGGMMFYAAENYGVRCVGYTLSKEQYNYVASKIKEKNLSHLLRVYLKDYRQAEGRFDKFVSIGMFEHVGRRFHSIFFDMVKKVLRPGGIGLLQTIGSTEDKPTNPWLTKYIFPGGFIPTLPRITAIMNERGLNFFGIEDLRMHYARTLNAWIKNFEGNIGKVRSVVSVSLKDKGMVEEFIRMWRLYLNGSSVAFKFGNNRLYQIIFSNGLNNNIPLTKNYIYGTEQRTN